MVTAQNVDVEQPPARSKHSPQRTCLGCRTVRPQHELVRLAVAEGTVVVDPTRLTAGRGGYICRATAEACLRRALRKRVLPRALKTPQAQINETALLRTLGALSSPQEIEP